MDDGFDLTAMADNPRICQQPGHIGLIEQRHLAEIELGESGAEILAFGKNGAPAQARLEAFEAELLEQFTSSTTGKPHSRS